MLRKILPAVLVSAAIVAVFCLPAMPLTAQQDKGVDLNPEEAKVQAEKNVQIANINAVRNQEVRTAVIQQIVNEETAKLMQMQAVFCDQYKLDIEKFRAGKYIYDSKTGKFSEK